MCGDYHGPHTTRGVEDANLVDGPGRLRWHGSCDWMDRTNASSEWKWSMKDYRPVWVLEMRDSDNPRMVVGDVYDDSATAEAVRR